MIRFLNREPPEPAWTRGQISAALERAETLILARMQTDRPGDLLGVVRNVALTFLADPGMDLNEAIEDACHESADTVIGWAKDTLDL